MRDVMKVAIVLLGVAVAAPVSAQDSQDVVVVGEPLEADQRVVCKKQKATGTRFEKKTCMTARQWEATREQNRRDLKEMIDRPEVNNNRG